MPKDRKTGLKSLRGLVFLAGSIGSWLPGFSSFLALAPPFFPGSAFITALAAALVLIVFALPQRPASVDAGQGLLEAGALKVHGRMVVRRREALDEEYKRGLQGAVGVILVSLLLAVFYIILLRSATVTSPGPPPTITCQTGFGLTSLTESARRFIEDHPARANPLDLMLAFAAFADCRTDLIWERGSIYSAGVALILLFSAASLLWAFGFARLATILSSGLSHSGGSSRAGLSGGEGSGERKRRASQRKGVTSLGFAIWWFISLLAAPLFSCVPERLASGHVKPLERIKNLEAKVKDLDARNSDEPPVNRR